MQVIAAGEAPFAPLWDQQTIAAAHACVQGRSQRLADAPTFETVTDDPGARMTISLNGRTLPASASYPPYPKTERQAEFIALGDTMAEIAAEQAEAHDRENSFPH